MPSNKSSKIEPAGAPKPIKTRASKKLPVLQGHLPWDPIGLMAGVDEAGRGPLAGPVVAAAVILDDTKRIRGLADSKMLTPLQRARLYDQIREKALCCSVAEATVEEIDTLNILWATMLAMKRAVEGLRLKPVKVLVDGNRLPTIDVLAEAVIGGDAKIKAISAASILAKVERDAEMDSVERTRDRGIAVTVYFGQRKANASTADLKALFTRFQGDATTVFPRVEGRIRQLASGSSLESMLGGLMR